MKKLLSLVLALVMMFGCASVFAEEAELTELYKSDFTAENFGGWFGNNCSIALGDEGALVISGRTAGWQTANIVCPLKANTEYKFSVAVYQDALDSANFKISAAQNDANWISTEPSAAVPKGEWTTIEGTLTTGDFTKFVLYVETDDDPEFNKIDFQIKDFTIFGPADGLAAAE